MSESNVKVRNISAYQTVRAFQLPPAASPTGRFSAAAVPDETADDRPNSAMDEWVDVGLGGAA